jgi:hypothetical protein
VATPVDVRCAIPATRGVKAGTFVGGKLAGGPVADALVAAGTLGIAQVGLTGSVALANVAASGALAGSSAPAWMLNATVGTWQQLPSSTVSGGPNADSYSGFILDNSLNVWFAAAGGHSNGQNNGVSKYPLDVDSPSGWVQVRAGSTPTPDSLPYYSDGRPNARHVYEMGFYDPDTNHLILVGCYAPAQGSSAFNPIDGFNITTGDWEPAGTYPYFDGGSSLASGGFFNGGFVRDPVTGNAFWPQSGATRMWKPGQATLTSKGTSIASVRFPNCWDTTRNGIFGLQWGDGQVGGTGVTVCHTINPSGTPTIRNVTIGASSAYTAFQAGTPLYGAMDYDPINDKYLFAHGTASGISGVPKFYEITPNAGLTWDMAVPSFAGSAGSVPGSGAVGKLKYIRRGNVGGFIFYSDSLYFLRTA